MEPPSLRDSLAIYAPFVEDRRRSTRNFPSRHTRCLGPVRCPRVSDVSVLVLLVVSLSTSSIATTPDTAKDILAAAKAVNDYALNQIVSTPYNPARGGGCQWTRSTFMMGLVEYYAASESMQAPDPRARDFLMNWGEAFQYQLCRAGPCTSWCGPCAPTNSSLGPALGCGDNQLCGAVYMELYKQGLDRPVPRSSSTLYASATEFDAEIALGKKADGTWHVIDTVYMAMAPLSRLGALTGKQKYFDKQWANWCSTVFGPLSASTITTAVAVDDGGKLWNATDRLFHRDQTKLGTNTYWGRGNGWAMLGLVDALRWGNATVAATGDRGVHQGDPHWSRYNAVYKTFAARLIELQGADGAWRSSCRATSSQHPRPVPPRASPTALHMGSMLVCWRGIDLYRR